MKTALKHPTAPTGTDPLLGGSGAPSSSSAAPPPGRRISSAPSQTPVSCPRTAEEAPAAPVEPAPRWSWFPHPPDAVRIYPAGRGSYQHQAINQKAPSRRRIPDLLFLGGLVHFGLEEVDEFGLLGDRPLHLHLLMGVDSLEEGNPTFRQGNASREHPSEFPWSTHECGSSPSCLVTPLTVPWLYSSCKGI